MTGKEQSVVTNIRQADPVSCNEGMGCAGTEVKTYIFLPSAIMNLVPDNCSKKSTAFTAQYYVDSERGI